MLQNKKMLTYIGTGTTAAAGVLHLIMSSNVAAFSASMSLFFLVAGVAQLFWVLPLIRRWKIVPWTYAGIGGTAVLVALWSITRVDNPIMGGAFPINAIGVATQILQVTFIGIMILMIFAERRKKVIPGKNNTSPS